jgi:hypothetical protein
LSMTAKSADTTVLAAAQQRVGSSKNAPIEGDLATPTTDPCSRRMHAKRLPQPTELRAVYRHRADKLLLPGGDRRRKCRDTVSSRLMI